MQKQNAEIANVAKFLECVGFCVANGNMPRFEAESWPAEKNKRKLTEQEVQKIKACGLPMMYIAKKIGIEPQKFSKRICMGFPFLYSEIERILNFIEKEKDNYLPYYKRKQEKEVEE